MFSKVVLCALFVGIFAEIPADVKAKIQAKIATLSPDAQKYAQKMLTAVESGNEDFETLHKNMKAIKEELKADPKASSIEAELKTIMPQPQPLTEEQKMQIDTIISSLSPAAKAIADQIRSVLVGNSEDKYQEIHSIMAGITDNSVKQELEKVKVEMIKVLPKPSFST